MLWLLVFLVLIQRKFLNPGTTNRPIHYFILLLGIGIILAFNGPLTPVIILLLGLLIYLEKLVVQFPKNWSDWLGFLKDPIIILLGILGLISLYSIYLGGHNIENATGDLALAQRYWQLPQGLWGMFTRKLGLPVLLGAITFNCFYLNKQKSDRAQKLLQFFKWIALFSCLYLFLLPFGGYRDYRPEIIRRDTFLPIMLTMIYIWGHSSFYLIQYTKKGKNRLYQLFITGVIIFFTLADTGDFKYNQCEKAAIQQIANAPISPVELSVDCTVLSWDKITDPVASNNNATLLKFWKITSSTKFYFQK